MVNPKLIEIYGDACKEPLEELINMLPGEYAKKVGVMTHSTYNINGINMPSAFVTGDGDKGREIGYIVEDWWCNHLNGKRLYVSTLRYGMYDNSCVPLYENDEESTTTVQISLELNPELLNFCGNESEDILNKLIKEVGSTVLTSTIKIISRHGTKYLNGVKVPAALSTKSCHVDYVQRVVNDLRGEWDGTKEEELVTYVYDETIECGDIPLCVQSHKHDLQSAISRMAGNSNTSGVEFIQSHIDKSQQHIPHLIGMANRLGSLSHDSNCMFLLGLKQHIESLYIVEHNRESGEYSPIDVDTYVQNEHATVYDSFKDLLAVTEYILSSCFTQDCIRNVKKFVRSDTLMDLLVEFGIVEKL